MTLPLRTTRAGLELIKSFEGFRARSTRLPDGRWTIGHGHVRTAREGVRISRDDAELLLIYDIRRIEAEIEDCLLSPLNANQYNSLVSFVYNISPGQFRQSDVLRMLNRGEHIAAAMGMEAWRKARINGQLMIVDALVRRRAAEKALFLEHPEGRALCPTPLISPEFDPQWHQSGDLELEHVPQKLAPEIEAEVENVTSAVEALADSPRFSVVTRPAETVDDDEDEDRSSPEHKTPEQAVAELKERISRVLEREEAVIGTPEPVVAMPIAPEPDSDADPDEQMLEAVRAVIAKEPSVTDRVDMSAESETAFEQPLSKKKTATAEIHDAFDLSVDLADQSEVFTRSEEAATEIEPRGSGFIDDTEIISLPVTDNTALEYRDQHDSASSGNRGLWGMLMAGAVGLMVWGLVDFFLKSQAAEVVSRQQVTFGPMLFLLGLILGLIGVYYFFVRGDDSEIA